MKRILIVDDDTTFCLMLKSFLSRHEFDAVAVNSVSKAMEEIGAAAFDLILTDYKMPQKDGMDLLRETLKLKRRIPVVLMTSYGDIRLAVQAIKTGAVDYLTKPINPSELLELVKNILSSSNTGIQTDSSATEKVASNDFVEGISPSWLAVRQEIDRVAPTNYSVIIEGESGTGKEYAARKIHQLSGRKNNPFIAIDCGTLSREMATSELFGHVKGSFTGAVSDKTGQFELAHTGTLFLDEIGNLSYDVQVKLLRAIQERTIRRIGGVKDIPIDVRILVATNENLRAAVNEGKFREDLYHRLNEFRLNLIPLRDRVADIKLFATFYLNQCNIELGKQIEGFEEEVIQLLSRYSWPGNLRELKNCIRRSALMTQGNKITVESLPSELKVPFVEHQPRPDTVNLKVLAENMERETILKALNETQFNKTKAAKSLNIDRKTLYNKMKEYNL